MLPTFVRYVTQEHPVVWLYWKNPSFDAHASMFKCICPPPGVSSLFTRIRCDSGTLSDLLGSSEGVKDDNIMQYLGIIEQRANELLAAQSYIDSQVSSRRQVSIEQHERARSCSHVFGQYERGATRFFAGF